MLGAHRRRLVLTNPPRGTPDPGAAAARRPDPRVAAPKAVGSMGSDTRGVRRRSSRPISTVAAGLHHEQGRRIRSISTVWLRRPVSTGTTELAPLPSQSPTATPSAASSAQGPSTVDHRIQATAFACSRLTVQS
ncbi:hypothetical protein ACP70R_034820 [Stipagrostis hirtigluma subsp. patula]